jgi:kelch-like protein 2/3
VFCLGLLGAGTVLSCYVCIVVRSKLDYVSFINGSATQGKLRILNPVHHAGIRLATGAFCSSPIVSLYAESGEPSLSVRRKLLLCSYASNLAAHIHHPSYSAFFLPAFRNHYERNTTAPWPAGLRFQQLLSVLHVTLPTVVSHKQMRVPSWLSFKATFDFSLTKYGKDTIPDELFGRHFAEVIFKYPDHKHIFTDRSLIRGLTGCSFVFDSPLFIFHLHPFWTIFTDDLYELYRALLHLRHLSPGRFLLLTDSLSSLHALSSHVSDNPLVVHGLCIISELLQHGHTIVFCWIPGHTVIPGNEAADSATLIGALNMTAICSRWLESDIRASLLRAVYCSWQGEWAEVVNNKMRVVKPSVRACQSSCCHTRTDQVILTRRRNGHSHLTHGFLLRGEDAPMCVHCDSPLSVVHIISNCPPFQEARDIYQLHGTIREILQGNRVLRTMF